MRTDIIKKRIETAENEIKEWLDKNGYDFDEMYIGNGFEIFLFEKISKKDLKNYEKTFKSRIIKIGGGSNNDCCSYPIYEFFHQLLDEFKEEVKNIINNKYFTMDLRVDSNKLIISTETKLKLDVLYEIGNKFNMTLIDYPIMNCKTFEFEIEYD